MARTQASLGPVLALVVLLVLGLGAADCRAEPGEMFTFAVFGAHEAESEAGAAILSRALETVGALSPDLAVFAGGGPAKDASPVAGVRLIDARSAEGFDHKWAHFAFLGGVADGGHDALANELAATDAAAIYLFAADPVWRTDPQRWEGFERVLREDERPATVFCVSDRYSRDDSAPSSSVRLYSLGPTGAFTNLEYEHDSFQQVTFVTVRRDGDRIATLPIDAGDPPVEPAAGWVFDELDAFRKSEWAWLEGGVRIEPDAGAESRIELRLFGMAPRTLEYSIAIDTDQGWTVSNRALRGSLEPGQELSFPITVTAPGIGARRPELSVTARAKFPLARGGEQVVTRVLQPRLDVVGVDGWSEGDSAGWARFNGRAGARVDFDRTPGDAFTLEMWVRGDKPRSGRSMSLAGLGSRGAFGLYWSDGGEGEVSLPVGFVRTDLGVFEARAREEWAWHDWTHLALTFDGTTVTLYVNGVAHERRPTRGSGFTGPGTMFLGANAGLDGRARDYFTGGLDDVRLSRGARYTGRFEPARRAEADSDTLGLWRFDRRLEGLLPDSSGVGNHAWAVGGITVQDGPRE